MKRNTTLEYTAPEMEVILTTVESGFQNSPSGFDGPYFDEEDVDW